MRSTHIFFALICLTTSLTSFAAGYGCKVFTDSSEKKKLDMDVQLYSDDQTILYVKRGRIVNGMRDMLDERSYSFKVSGTSSPKELRLDLAVQGDVGRWLTPDLEESEWRPIFPKTPGYLHLKGRSEKVLSGPAVLPFIESDRVLHVRCEPFVEYDHCGLFFCL